MNHINSKQNKSATSGTAQSQTVKCGSVYKAVVYDNFAGCPIVVAFLGNRWWVVTPGEKVQPLEEYIDDEDISFRFLCEAGGKVGALALARMLGVALENPEDRVDEVLRQRVKSLERLGVTLDVKRRTAAAGDGGFLQRRQTCPTRQLFGDVPPAWQLLRENLRRRCFRK